MNIETLQIAGFEAAIQGMRAPLKSYNKSDSYKDENGTYVLGEKDKELAMKLRKAGPEHCKWMRQIQVWCKITAPIFFWTEFDTYKVSVSANSESTMHTLMKKELNYSDFDPSVFQDEYSSKVMGYLIDNINNLIRGYNTPNLSKQRKDILLTVVKGLLPTSYMQTRYINLNYAVLANMYHQRKNHRLPHWRITFCDWVRSLPYYEFIIDDDTNLTKDNNFDII